MVGGGGLFALICNVWFINFREFIQQIKMYIRIRMGEWLAQYFVWLLVKQLSIPARSYMTFFSSFLPFSLFPSRTMDVFVVRRQMEGPILLAVKKGTVFFPWTAPNILVYLTNDFTVNSMRNEERQHIAKTMQWIETQYTSTQPTTPLPLPSFLERNITYTNIIAASKSR